MKYLLIFTTFFLLSCGGGATVAAQNTSDIKITGLQGDINAIEPVDLD